MRKMTIFLTLALLTIICQAPQQPADEVKRRTDNLLSELLRLKQEKAYNQEFQRYADFLGYKESLNNHLSINSIGCFGEFQFQDATLRYLGYKITLKAFKKDARIFPRKMQIEALKSLTKVNWILLEPFQDYLGKEINGIIITKSGLLAGCHLGGIGSVRTYLLSNGRVNKKDCYGTSIASYIKDFKGFNI